MVMSAHLLELPFFGGYAVFSFYIVSGYLMTRIMHEGYGYSGRGRLNFSINRVLRIYPQYWFATLFSIFLLLWIGVAPVRSYHNAIYFPVEIKEILETLFLLYASWNPVSVIPRLVPPSWALTVEIFFYVLICLGASKNIKRVKIWVVLSLLYLIATYLHMTHSWYLRYYPIPAASLPFSIGCLIYFLRGKIAPPPEILLMLFLINASVFSIYSAYFDIGQYINLLIVGLLVHSLASGKKFCLLSKTLDASLGAFSYPIYLLHWQTALLVSYIVFGSPVNGHTLSGLVNYGLTIIAIFLISFGVIKFIDKPIEKIRARFKSNKVAF